MPTEIETAKIEGAQAERERIAAIVALPEAKGREAVAIALAIASSASADECRATLMTFPKAAPATGLRPASESPLGLALYETPQSASGALSPSEVAGNINRENGR